MKQRNVIYGVSFDKKEENYYDDEAMESVIQKNILVNNLN